MPEQIPQGNSQTQELTSTTSMMMKSNRIPTTLSDLATPVPWNTDKATGMEGIEKPEASARPNPETKDSGLPVGGRGGAGMNQFQFVLSERDAYERERKIVDKYKSIDSLNKADKIKALSDTNLNPYRLANPYDGLANSLHRWKSVAAQANNGRYSEAEMGKIASNYYDKMIAPLYGGLGIAPMDKNLWLKQAYSEALKYNLEDSYDSSITHGLKNGWHTGLGETARAYGYVTDMLGNVLDDSIALWKRAHTVQSGQTSEQVRAAQATPWYQTARDMHNFLSGVHHDRGMVSRGAQFQSDKQDFWAQALPLQDGWVNHATSFIAEQAAQLPVYAAMELGGAVLKSGAALSAEQFNLTKSLMKSGLGKKVFSYLMAGTEGLGYGKATRRQEDKAQAWRDALGFTVFHGIFDIGGMGLKKLIDVVPKDSPEGAKLAQRNEVLDLAQEGRRPATGAEIYADHKKEVANNLAVAGITGQRAIFKDALDHIDNIQREHSSWSRTQIREYEHSLLNDDPARWGPVLSAAKFVRSLAGDKRIADLTEDEQAHLGERIEKLIQDSGAEINTHAQAMQEGIAAKTVKDSMSLESKKTLDLYRAKVISKITKENPAALKMLKPEQIDIVAARWMAKDAQKSAVHAESTLGKDRVKEATNAAKRSKGEAVPKSAKGAAQRQTKELASFTTVRKEDKFGQPSVSYKAESPETSAYFKNAVKSAKENGQTLREFFEDMSDEDFAKDVSEHFYPAALKKANIFFEHQNTPEGRQDPNFLAFMYNYTSQMPKEFGKELEQRLIESMKVQKYMNGKKPTGVQLDYFAKAMYNHMDNFVNSGRWPNEANIFRSSNEQIFKTTRWQRQLLQERMIREQNNLKNMFSNDPAALQNAMTAYKLLAQRRIEEYEAGPKNLESQQNIKDIDERIHEVIPTERISF